MPKHVAWEGVFPAVTTQFRDDLSLDIDANLGTPSRYGVLSIPTVILFEGGEAQETVVGAHGKGRYQRTFAPYLDG